MEVQHIGIADLAAIASVNQYGLPNRILSQIPCDDRDRTIQTGFDGNGRGGVITSTIHTSNGDMPLRKLACRSQIKCDVH